MSNVKKADPAPHKEPKGRLSIPRIRQASARSGRSSAKRKVSGDTRAGLGSRSGVHLAKNVSR